MLFEKGNYNIGNGIKSHVCYWRVVFFNSEKKQGQHANSEKGTLKVHCDYSDLMF